MTKRDVILWMMRNAERFEGEDGKINRRLMVETWDREAGDGSSSDPKHYAWYVAELIGNVFEGGTS